MLELFNDVAAPIRGEIPRDHRRRVGVVGAGAIMDVAHLPAYRSIGIEVVAITDLDRAKADDVAKRHSIVTVHDTLDELLEDAAVEVVDIAIAGAAQPAAVRACLQADRHVLGQKPFAPSANVAAELVQLAADRGLVLAVNQQLRFEEAMTVAKNMVDQGWLGELTALTIDVDIWTAWESWPWMLETDRLEIVNHSIHYHDVVRWFMGEPTTVFCAAGRTPGQAPSGETRTMTTALYESGARSLVHANHENDRGDDRALFRIDGSEGSLRGTFGLLYDYPHGRPSTLEVTSRAVGSDGWVPYPVTTRWIPDAFAGPMSELLRAVSEGGEPLTSARDNLGTLRVVEALYESIRTGQAVDPGRRSTR